MITYSRQRIVTLCALLLMQGAFAQIGISSVEELQRIGHDPAYPLDGKYVLTRDIDASVTATWDDGMGFAPIGVRLENDDSEAFNGSFDGQGFVIRDLYIHRPDQFGVGLFASVGRLATVVNVGIEDAEITGGHYVGILVGENWSGIVAACHVSGRVSGVSRVGGLAGINRGMLDACYAIADVSGEKYLGGLIGRNYRGLAAECYAAGSVNGVSGVGGLIGESFEAEVFACFWDAGASDLPPSEAGWGVSSTAMMDRRTFTDAGWDFQELWDIRQGSSYPFHRR